MPTAGVSASSSVTVFGPGAPAGSALASAESKKTPVAAEVYILKMLTGIKLQEPKKNEARV